MCGIASHLNFLEPANFAFSYLLASGMLESVYTETVRAQGRDSAIETLISILSYFFCPIPLTRLQRRSLKRLEGPSKLLLPPLPKRVLDEVNLHASQVKQMVENYLKCASMAYEKELSDFDTLPLSGIKSSACGSESKSGLLSEISQTASISVRLRSKYLAVNGICDSFSSLKEISMTTRQKLAFNPLFVPVLEFDPSIMYNSFLLDYYKHSNYSALSRYNGISVGDLFDLVKGFILCLRAVAAAQTVAEPDSLLTGVLVEIGAKYKKIFDEETK